MQASFYSQRRWNCFLLCLATPCFNSAWSRVISWNHTRCNSSRWLCPYIQTQTAFKDLVQLEAWISQIATQNSRKQRNMWIKQLKPTAGIANTLITAEQRSFHLLRGSGIFPTLAKILKGNPRCAVKAAHVLSEIAKNGKSCSNITAKHLTAHYPHLFTLEFCFTATNCCYCNCFIPSLIYTEEMKIPCIEADLVLALIPLLESTDQEMLLHAGRAIGRICYDNRRYPLKGICSSLPLRLYFKMLYFKRHCNLELIITSSDLSTSASS